MDWTLKAIRRQGDRDAAVLLSADPELREWLRWASEGGNTPMFVRTVAEAALMACTPDYVLLRPVLLELKRRYPQPAKHPYDNGV